MSFTRTTRSADSSFDLVKRSLLQRDGLPFAEALTVVQIEQAFEEEGVSFNVSESPCETKPSPDEDRPIYTMGVTLWAMLSQAIFDGSQRSCRAAVQRVAVYSALRGLDVSSTNTGAYSRARAKVPEGVVQRLTEGVAERCERVIPEGWRWKGFRALVVDGTTHSMPDTKQNQEEYPQSSTQKEGLGFPILRAVALTSLATGMVIGHTTGPYQGKESGETALFRTLFPKLREGDLVLADRYYGGWFMLALLLELGVEVVTRLHQHREADFDQGTRLGTKDHLTTWAKPARPEWLDQEAYDRLPEHLELRELEVAVNVPGFRCESFVVVTSLRDHRVHSYEEIAALYRRRWIVEIELRDIKVTMGLGILRRKTPAAVRQEIWTGLLAYNLIRQSALASECQPNQLSFAASLQMIANTWVLAAVPPLIRIDDRERLIALRILNGYCHRIANRPSRIEPRAVKRRPAPIALLTEPRKLARKKLVTKHQTS
ncbi:IS4 family transposase [Schlesneria paludicola]|uniref:IS4 family transposase n=1 Tax=Schlesneria paludicola TaxID=360056 RepID=UPI00029A43F5|nr:IS4 family transposase [Schlesneria paludicola]